MSSGPTPINVDLVYPLYLELRSLVTVPPRIVEAGEANALYDSGTAAQHLRMPWVWGCWVEGKLHAQLNRTRLLTRVLRDAPGQARSQAFAYAELLAQLLAEDIRNYLATLDKPEEEGVAPVPGHDPGAQARLHQVIHESGYTSSDVYKFAFRRSLH